MSEKDKQKVELVGKTIQLPPGRNVSVKTVDNSKVMGVPIGNSRTPTKTQKIEREG
jgi:hypothetical protein